MTTIKTTASRRASGFSAALAARQVAGAVAVAWATFRNRRSVARLREFDDHLLADIGLTRADVDAAAMAPIHMDPTVELAIRAAGNARRDRPRGRRGDAFLGRRAP